MSSFTRRTAVTVRAAYRAQLKVKEDHPRPHNNRLWRTLEIADGSTIDVQMLGSRRGGRRERGGLFGIFFSLAKSRKRSFQPHWMNANYQNTQSGLVRRYARIFARLLCEMSYRKSSRTDSYRTSFCSNMFLCRAERSPVLEVAERVMLIQKPKDHRRGGPLRGEGAGTEGADRSPIGVNLEEGSSQIQRWKCSTSRTVSAQRISHSFHFYHIRIIQKKGAERAEVCLFVKKWNNCGSNSTSLMKDSFMRDKHTHTHTHKHAVRQQEAEHLSALILVKPNLNLKLASLIKQCWQRYDVTVRSDCLGIFTSMIVKQ